MALTFPDGTPFEQRILYDQQGVLVLNKPPGLPTTGRSLEDPDCLQWYAIERCRHMVWAAHQLDADTSGAVVFVRRRALVPIYQKRLTPPTGVKTYLAWVHGTLHADALDITAPLGPLEQKGYKLGVIASGKPAHSRVTTLQANAEASLVQVTLFTGRTHQIRIHLSHLGHPLIGEGWYRTEPCTRHPRQALHAWRIRFSDGAPPAAFEAPVPDDLLQLSDSLGLGTPWMTLQGET